MQRHKLHWRPQTVGREQSRSHLCLRAGLDVIDDPMACQTRHPLVERSASPPVIDQKLHFSSVHARHHPCVLAAAGIKSCKLSGVEPPG